MKSDNDKNQKEEEKEVDNEGETKETKETKKSEKEELEKKVEECEDKYKRALADYQNLQKRVSEEKVDWIRGANKELLLRILPVFDTLVLAGKHSSDASLKITLLQFQDTLKAEGIVKIETVGKQFDPATMEAIETVEGEEGKVIEELRAGYMLYDKLLRPAQVKVGKK